MTNCRDATFPENPGKILNLSGVGLKGKDKRFLDYSYFLLPAKITDGASYTQICIEGSTFRKPGEPANYLQSFGKIENIHYSVAFKTLVLLLFSPKKEASCGYTQTLLLPSND